MFGYTEPVSPTSLGPRWNSWINEDAVARADELGQTRFNPEMAAALLDESGYVDSDGDGIRNMPDGGPNITFNVQVVNGWNDWVTSVQIISQGLQDIGLGATIQTPDFGAWFANLQSGDYDVSIGWGTAGNTPYNNFRNLLLSNLIVEGVANAELWHRWTSEEADALLTAFTATADLEEQQDIINQLQMLYIENVITIPLFAGPTWYEYTTYRFVGWPTEANYYAQGSPWEANSRQIVVNTIHCIDQTSCGQ